MQIRTIDGRGVVGWLHTLHALYWDRPMRMPRRAVRAEATLVTREYAWASVQQSRHGVERAWTGLPDVLRASSNFRRRKHATNGAHQVRT